MSLELFKQESKNIVFYIFLWRGGGESEAYIFMIFMKTYTSFKKKIKLFLPRLCLQLSETAVHRRLQKSTRRPRASDCENPQRVAQVIVQGICAGTPVVQQVPSQVNPRQAYRRKGFSGLKPEKKHSPTSNKQS